MAIASQNDTLPNIAPSVTDRQQELTALLRKAADAYYNEGIELMTNYEYDALFDELAELEAKSGVTLPDSPTEYVGADADAGIDAPTGLAKVTHEVPMLSLAKTKDRASLAGWLGDHAGCLSWKLDGSSVSIRYEGGRLVQAVTRGNGRIGEDITEQARRFGCIPDGIPFTGRLVIRGEALMTYTEFNRINALQPETEQFKNPRNLASGTMRQLDLSILDERKVEFHPFEVVEAQGLLDDPDNGTITLGDGRQASSDSLMARLDLLAEWGFSPVQHFAVDAVTVEAKVDELEHEVDENDFPSDGLVLQYDSVSYGRSLGSTGHHPRSGIALKWEDEAVDTKLRDIVWSPGRSGVLTPVAIFDPVEIYGTTVRQASLHNVSVMHETLGTPFVGEGITITKANMIIPMVVGAKRDEAHDPSSEFVLPDRCPICGGAVSVHRDHDSDALYCENPDCEARGTKRLAHFVSRDAMNVMGLSDERLQGLMDAGVVSSFVDILDLAEKRDQVVGKIDRWGDRMFAGICVAIETARHAEARRVLYSFGIREIGRSASRDICKAFDNDLDAVMACALAGDKETLTAIPGVGPVMAEELVSYVRANEDMMREVISRIDIVDSGVAEDEPATDSFVAGKTFVITGAVHTFANRSAFKAYVEAQGGKVAGSVSKNTDYLVTNTPDSGTGKNKKARELGTAIITEDQFCEMAGYVA